MDMITEIIIWLVIAIILFLISVYLLLPWIFKKFVSPYFNASYVYEAIDFKEKKKKLSEQINTPNISIKSNNGIFKVTFGKNRNLIEGILTLYAEGNLYSNLRRFSNKSTMLEIKNINKIKSEDDLGKFEETKMEYESFSLNITIKTSIKKYENQNFLIFELNLPNGIERTGTKDYENLITSFPSFINHSPNERIFTYREAIFCPPSRKLKATSSPVVLYDENLNSIIISPLDGFLNTAISQEKNGRINCGIQGEIKSLPADFSQKFILYFGNGINKPMKRVGDILLKYHNTQRKDLYSDIVCSHLGYWTDNGAYYYYKTEKGLNYEDTMVGIKNYFETKNIPIRYYNFDSWWYLKHTNKLLTTIFRPIVRLLGGGFYGNTMRWEIDPEKFSTDLKTFHRERFQKPITAHNRRWDARSPYLKEYKFITYKNHACPLNLDFWSWLMRHASESGIIVYEQDWMKNQIDSIPYLREKIDAKEKWLKNMARAGRENGVNVFYCMETPGITLYSIKHPNITITRCSGDYNHRWPLTYRYVHSTQTNILIHAVGLVSHPDVFRSRSMEGVKLRPFGEKHPKFKCLYQILNAGPVCPGDKKENVNWSLLKKTCKNDGLLLKPDKPLTANDLMFKPHRKYYICDSYIKRNNLIWRFILISNIWPKRVKETFFTPKELGFQGDKFVLYDYFKDKMRKISNTQKIELGKLNKYEYKYLILNPVFENAIALIGCIDKFIPCSKKQIFDIDSDGNSLSFTVKELKNTKLKIILYADKKPEQISLDGNKLSSNINSDDYWTYDESSRRITIHLNFIEDDKKDLGINI